MRQLALAAVLLMAVLPHGYGEADRAEPARGALRHADSSQPSAEPVGDVIIFKDGKTLSDVQVYRRRPDELVVEVVPGVKLNIPRSQVLEVIYDDYEPALRHGMRHGDALRRERSIPGKRMAPELDRKLTEDISRHELAYSDADILDVLDDLAEVLGVSIIADESLEQVPPEQRRWSFIAEPETTLRSLLRDELQNRFEYIEVEYSYDAIHVKVKGNGEEAEAE